MENITKIIEQLDSIVNKYNDLIGTEAENLRYEHSIDSAETIRKNRNIMENNGRLLQIGIVGRVKAGKSSLLNALLFDGEPILPKAATPMTAALTILSFGEKLSAEVEFFSKKDILDIADKHKKYTEKFEELTESKYEELKKIKERKSQNLSQVELDELKEKSYRVVQKDIRENVELSAAFDQFNRIKDSGVNSENFVQNKILECDNISTLSQKLMDYVGADGKYMPFTKGVHIKLSQENLKDLQIVDTPGINDAVLSREKRTRELLKTCDVVFVVSPSGHFLSSQDLELMDRITGKEGIRELFVIASQVDTQLFGSEKNKYNGNLSLILSGITSNLGEHMSSTLLQLKEQNPEVGDTFEQLIKQGGGKVIHSSGICQSMKLLFEKREKWEDGSQKVWENLTKYYPDYFSDTDKTLSISNLSLLSNTVFINNAIRDIREKKDEIMKKRTEEYIQAKGSSITKFKECLISFAKEQFTRIKKASVEELSGQKKSLEKIQKKASSLLLEEYTEIVDELAVNLKNELSGKLNSYFNDTKKAVDGTEETKTETYQVDNGMGFLGWRSLFGSRYETRTRTLLSVRVGAIKSILESLTSDIENTISTKAHEYILQWKKNLNSNLIKVLMDNVADEDLEPNLIRSSIREVLNSIRYPELEYGDQMFSESMKKNSGTLVGSAAETFLDDTKNHIRGLTKKVNNDIKGYIDGLIYILKNYDPSSKILGNYKERISELEEQIKSKQIILARIEKLTAELEGCLI